MVAFSDRKVQRTRNCGKDAMGTFAHTLGIRELVSNVMQSTRRDVLQVAALAVIANAPGRQSPPVRTVS